MATTKSISKTLRPVLSMRTGQSDQLDLKFPKRVVYQKLAELAAGYSEKAYCPFSDYPVGVAALLWDGSVYKGVNTENHGLNLTVHGEMSALNGAIADGALARALAAGISQFDFVKCVAVIPQRSFEAWPCGHCRDFLSGFGQKMDITVWDPSKTVKWKQLRRLLPGANNPEHQFNPVDHLRLQRSIVQAGLAGGKTRLQVPSNSKFARRQLMDLAVEASYFSYVPYTKRPVGAAALLYDDSVYIGSRVENVGYSLSIDAEQVAISAAIADGALKRAISAGIHQHDFIKYLAYAPLAWGGWPTGSSLQCLCDFGTKFRIITEADSFTTRSRTVAQLLPNAFVPDVLSYWTK